MVVNIVMETAILKLTQIGFSNYEARAYAALLRDNPLTAYEIAKNSGIPSSKVYEVIRRLEERNTIQSIHEKRSRMYIPVSPDELIESYKLNVENSLIGIKNSLKGVKVGIDTNYTWHITRYEDIILRAKRMLGTVRERIVLQIWPDELQRLKDDLVQTERRGVRIAVIHYGPTKLKTGKVYRHSVKGSLYTERGFRGLTIVADSKEALAGKISGPDAAAIWSMSDTFVIMAEDYLLHDIYMIKTMERFNPVMREAFGQEYENMLDVF